ncbi:hypothetical protein [Streptomyces sp. NPDC058695]|uniref:hypothetical protein n=1 Tax=Streptomyces sp. NPDC058695 TaxID=3346604 RepID=UPI003648FAEA
MRTENPLGPDDGPAGPTGPEGAGGFENLLAAAVCSAKPRDGGEERAVAAFRAARDRGAHSARTRRRDDWRPRRRHGLSRWSVRTGVGALLASITLGGVAMAGIGAVNDTSGDDAERPPTPRRSAPGTPGRQFPEQIRPPAAAVTPPGVHGRGRSAGHPDQARDLLAKCRAYDSVRGRGKALGAPAWQRLVAAAGGEASVDAYCAGRPAGYRPGNGTPGPQPKAGTPEKPAKPLESEKPPKAEKPEKTGK